MSAAVPADQRAQANMKGLDIENGGGNSLRHTASPRILRSCVPVLVIKAKGKQVPCRVEGDTRGTAHYGRRKEVKSDDGG